MFFIFLVDDNLNRFSVIDLHGSIYEILDLLELVWLVRLGINLVLLIFMVPLFEILDLLKLVGCIFSTLNRFSLIELFVSIYEILDVLKLVWYIFCRIKN